MLSRFEKRLCIAALVFVAIYLGAIALTLYHRSEAPKEQQLRYETAEVKKAESRIALVHLLPPMLVLLTMTVAFMVVKKKRAQQLIAMEDSDASEEAEAPSSVVRKEAE